MKKLIISSLSFIPALGYAAGIPAVNTLVNKISDVILKPLVYLMFALASLVFIWGAQGFVGAADDAEARSKGAQQMLWGIVGMIIMLGAAVLVPLIGNTAKTL